MKKSRARRNVKRMFLVSASMLALAFATLAQAQGAQKWEPAPVPAESTLGRHAGPNGGAPDSSGDYDPERDYPGYPSCRGPVSPFSSVPCINSIYGGPY